MGRSVALRAGRKPATALPPLLNATFSYSTFDLAFRSRVVPLQHDLKTVFSTVIKNMGSTLGACGDVNRNVMGACAPYVNRPDYVAVQKAANDIADLLAPQSGAYYDMWLDGEKFVSVYKEVRAGCGARGSGVEGQVSAHGLEEVRVGHLRWAGGLGKNEWAHSKNGQLGCSGW